MYKGKPHNQKQEGTMHRIAVAMLIGCLTLSLLGCMQTKTASSKEAIQVAKDMETTQEKLDYLIAQAEAFYHSQEFRETLDLTNHILRYLDRNCQAARDLMKKAKEALATQAKGAM